MEISLTRKQLQATLREMGIDFPADACREDLQALLDQANQRQWLKAAHGTAAEKRGRIVRRRDRTREGPTREIVSAKSPAPARTEPSRSTIRLRRVASPPAAEAGKDVTAGRKARGEESEQTLVRSRNVEAYALQRANGVCDLCGMTAGIGSDERTGGLRPFFLNDPSQPPTVKTVTALCPDCLERMRTAPELSDLKALKRKARQSRIKEIVVTKKPPPGTKRPPAGARKPRK
jgi:hypothetical protein